MPVLAGAKVGALETVEVSQLRQLGQAREMYLTDSPASECRLPELAGFVPSGELIVSSPLDPDPQGRSNRISKDLVSFGGAPVDYSVSSRISYIGYHTFGWPAVLADKYLDDKPRRGWLLSFSRSQPKRPNGDMIGGLRGKYMRLLLDGSVIKLNHGSQNFQIEGPERETGDSPFFDFADWTEKEKNDIFKEN
jgi:hypothetical protein